jgi:hypothetical protein
MKQIAFTLMIVLFTITACAPATGQSIATNEPATSQPDDVNTNESSTLQPSDAIPVPADSSLTRGNAELDSTELLTMESYPLQFMLVLKGNLPTPCHGLRVAASPPDSQNKIVVDVYSVADPNTICAQVVEPFEENFPLGSFPTGHYILWVNGEQVTEFDS